MSDTPERTPQQIADDVREHLGTGFDAQIGLTFRDLGPDRVTADYEVGPHLLQPFGIVHGGVHCAVIESVASTGGALWFGDKGQVVGVNNSTDFIRAAREGLLTAEGVPVHRGRTQQLWIVTITDSTDRLIARGQVRLQNIEDTTRLGG